ncbi:MAG: hypothetical protein A3J06_03975 [Candidatus Moranbacteria bacterium RIFCSPLOWO2_02_FULL_48_19]|nr:MAG: hypothetical protein A3J06_03975 [Candidatus Moranbacteria bacterium RIFCSPLOWO2_02_FULL_48_19]
MAKKWLNHHEWVNEQFQEKYLTKTYRNVIIHSSLIEGILRHNSGEHTFDSANKSLLSIKKIDLPEFCMFKEISKTRNSIIHKIFERSLSQKSMDKLLRNLRKKILEAYKTSDFLGLNLFKKYKIPPI